MRTTKGYDNKMNDGEGSSATRQLYQKNCNKTTFNRSNPKTRIVKNVHNPNTRIVKDVYSPNTKIVKKIHSPSTRIVKDVHSPSTMTVKKYSQPQYKDC